MSNERGMTLIETLIVVAAAALMLVAAAAYSVPWIARENMRSAVYDVQTYIQLTRIEAVSRNRECRMVLDTSARVMQIFDTQGTVSTSDDTSLYRRGLPTSVTFARPDSGAAVTLASINSKSFHVIFRSDGTVRAGVGDVHIFGGQRYGKVSIFGAGGTQVERWNGSQWEIGS